MSARDIFGADADTSTRYAVELKFRHLVVGGVPGDRSVIEQWLRARMDLVDRALAELVDQTVAERGVLTPDEAIEAVMSSPLAPSVNGFKRYPGTGVPCIEGRIVKAALKEWINSAYPGVEWPGKAKYLPNKKGDASVLKKGLMKYAAEAVIVPEVFIPLEDAEGDLVVEERIKHVMTPQGPRSAINRSEVVPRATVKFHVDVRDDFLPTSAWGRIWSIGEGIGLGADRGRSDGQFDLIRWEQVKK